MVRSIEQREILAKSTSFLDGPFGTPARELFLLAEVGSSHAYDVWHIKNAIYLAPPEWIKRFSVSASRKGKLPWPEKGIEIIIYGYDATDQMPDIAANDLMSLGFLQLFIYRGGKKDWKESGLPGTSTLVLADGFINVEQYSQVNPAA